MLYLKVEDYAKRTGMTHQAVYQKIKKGELQTERKAHNGKLIQVICIEELAEQVAEVAQVAEQNESLRLHEKDRFVDPNKMLELLATMYEDNKCLAEKAGQVKLLEDSESKTKQEYFQIIQENKMLSQERAELKAKLDIQQQTLNELQEKLKDQKNTKPGSSFWSKL